MLNGKLKKELLLSKTRNKMCPNLIWSKISFAGLIFSSSNFQLLAGIFDFLCRFSFLFATDVFLEKFQKGFLVRLGRPRRLFIRFNLISGWIWLEFKLIQHSMPVLVTCKFDDDPIKNTGAIRSTAFLPAL